MKLLSPRLCAFALIIISLSSAAADPQVPRKAWTCETSMPVAQRLELVYGETIDLQCRFLSYAVPIDILGADVTLHARTNGMAEGISFQAAGTAGPNGLASVRLAVDGWLPSGLTNVAWTLEIAQTNAVRILRSYGTATLSGSASASTAAPDPSYWPALAAELAPLVAELVSLAETDPLAGPRLDRIEAETNTWRAAYGWGNHALAGYLTSFTETDPFFAAWLGSNTYVRTELDPLAGPRLDRIEAETNTWRAAYGWGNHALAGYLTSFTEADPIFAAWLGSNTYVRAENDSAALAALAAFAQTNRVTRWQDSADTNIWWSAVGGTSLVATVWGDVETTGWHFSGSAEILALPYPLGAFGEAQDVWCIYDMMGIDLLIHYRPAAGIHYEGQIPFGGLDTSFTLIDYETGRPNLQAVYSPVWVYSPKASAAFNLTTGNVWQAVADARLAADQAAALAGEHAAAADPHPGLFASADITNAPAWLVYTNIAAAVTVTNRAERPVRIYGTGANTGLVSFAALREPLPLFFEASGFAALSFPDAYVIGGGVWQTNMVNLFIAFASGTNTFVTPITAREP